MNGDGDRDPPSRSNLPRPERRAPRIATALLDRLAPDQEAMVGDLLEAYHSGRSRAWYWRQVIIAVALSTARDGRDAPRVFVLAPALGWIVVAGILVVAGRLLTHGAVGEWLLDRVIAARWEAIAAGTDTFALAWTMHGRSLPAGALAFLIGGWVVARRYPAQPAASLLAFVTTAIAVLALSTTIIAGFGGPAAVPYTLRLVLAMKASFLGVAGMLLAPLLILIGGMLGISLGGRSRRAHGGDAGDLTQRAR
jgi:hypothetical protein